VTASKWWHRYEDGGGAGLGNRSSRPRHCPGALEARWVEEVEGMRRTHKWSGPDQLPDSGSAMGWATRPRAVGRWLERLGISRRRDLGPTGGPDRAPGVIRARYRGHMDVKKVGHPHGGGWRVHGRGTLVVGADLDADRARGRSRGRTPSTDFDTPHPARGRCPATTTSHPTTPRTLTSSRTSTSAHNHPPQPGQSHPTTKAASDLGR